MGSRSIEETHPYTGYNKGDEVISFVGNWTEERALKEKTGTNRFESWATQGPEEMSQSIYATKAVAPSMPTFPGVIEHNDALAPQDWESVYKRSYVDSKSADAYPSFIEYKDKSSLGPREKRELAALMEEARSLPRDTNPPIPAINGEHDLNTTQRTDYTPKDMSDVDVGTRVMHDQCGRPARRDPTFLAETQIVPRPLGDRLFGTAPMEAGATQTVTMPDPDFPISIHTEFAATKRLGDAVTFNGTRPVGSCQPFNKNCNFSKTMSDYSKVIEDE